MSRAVGNRAETIATEFLMRQGCRIVDRNVYSRFGEIDIVAEKAGVLRFVEVKSGTTFEPIYNITPAKLGRLIRSIEAYLKKNRLDLPFQLDAVIVRGTACEWVENITI
ncbi:YraN family protein [Hydrogenimonas urashimensis]|uniref:YraN family protein n=1 Tax=Hydrogenimonas urashimensis TaxID=2740515 RepID=UPI0019159211|nr:YraN family protein [Hydrogenimonas urashimensis]